MKNFILLIVGVIFSVIVFSCTSSNVKILTLTSDVVNGVEKVDSVFSTITTEYVDMELHSYVNGKKWGVLKEIEYNYTDSANHKYVYSILVDEKSNQIMFAEPSEFANYMSKNGYNVISKDEKKYTIKYSFKKK